MHCDSKLGTLQQSLAALMGSQDETPSCKRKCAEALFPQDRTRSKSVRHGRVRPHENKEPIPGAMKPGVTI